MPNTETNQITNPKTEDPLSSTIRCDLQGRRIDLSTLNENDRIELDALILKGEGLTHLRGIVIVRGNVLIRNCPDLVSIQNIQSTKSIRIEGCPKLSQIDVLESAKNAHIYETGIREITDKWYVGNNLIVENNPSLESVDIHSVSGVASFNYSPNLKSVSGNFDDILFLEGCSLESLKGNASRIVGLDENEIAFLKESPRILLKQKRRVLTDKVKYITLKPFDEMTSNSDNITVHKIHKTSKKTPKLVKFFSSLGLLIGLKKKKHCRHNLLSRKQQDQHQRI